MQVIGNASVSSIKGYRYKMENELRKVSANMGAGMNLINRVADTAGNFLSANSWNFANRVKDTVINAGNDVGVDIAEFFTAEDNALSVEDANRMLVKGDHIRIMLHDKYGCFYHHGIYCGEGVVIEYNGRYPSQDLFTVEKVSLESFARGRRIEVDNREPALYSPEEIVARAESRLGERAYNLYTNNCENFATWCRSGAPLVRMVS